MYRYKGLLTKSRGPTHNPVAGYRAKLCRKDHVVAKADKVDTTTGKNPLSSGDIEVESFPGKVIQHMLRIISTSMNISKTSNDDSLLSWPSSYRWVHTSRRIDGITMAIIQPMLNSGLIDFPVCKFRQGTGN